MMSNARFNSVFNGLTSTAKKVYEAVPIAEAWPPAKVATELQRIGSSIDFRVISGCLSSLSESGLVREHPMGHFRREPVKEILIDEPKIIINEPKAEKMAVKNNNSVIVAPIKQTPIDRLGALSQRAVELSRAVSVLASDIGDAAIEIQTEMEEKGEDSNKLRQLQTLLKSIGSDA